jgi:hypothetical protein
MRLGFGKVGMEVVLGAPENLLPFKARSCGTCGKQVVGIGLRDQQDIELPLDPRVSDVLSVFIPGQSVGNCDVALSGLKAGKL